MEGYRKDRQDAQAGGVALYVSDQLEHWLGMDEELTNACGQDC